MFRFFALLISMILSVSLVGEEAEEIIVRLPTEKQLLPIHVSKFIDQNSSFSSNYLTNLEEIFLFDLNHNGMSYTVPQEKNAFYLIQAEVVNKNLNVKLISTNNHSAKSIERIEFTGDLSHDRKIIHQLADGIHKELFGLKGIASTRFLYTLKLKNGSQYTSDVWEADYDGGNPRQITFNCGYCITPTYLPPKAGFASGSFFFVSYKTGQSKIYIASIKDGKAQRFNLLKGNQLMPAISAQRDKVAFISDFTGNPDLFLQLFDPDVGPIDKPRQIYATHKATQGTPSFSPDGNRIAFVSNKDGSPRIYVIEVPKPGMNFKDIKAKLISKINQENSAPAWSPDGTKIAYCSMTQGVRQIWIYDLTKDEEKQLSQGPGNKENPTWAPNSLHLIFNSTGKDNSELYLINLNQSNAAKISSGPGEKRFPSWEPKPE